MLAALSAMVRSRAVVALALSLALHLLLVGAGLLGFGGPPTPVPRRGDALFVELPEPREPAPRGTPSVSRPSPSPGRATPRLAPEPPARARREPAPRVSPPQARVAREQVVPAPAPVPRPSQTAQALTEPAPTRPAPSDPSPAPSEPSPAPEPVRRPPPEPARPVPAAPPAARPGGPGEPGPRLAAVPPGPPAAPGPPAPQYDLRSGLGGPGGGGGRGEGRGGIEGEPIPLDTKDPRYSDYLEEIRRRIKSNWGFPCVRDPATRACDYKSAQLVIEFGIAKDGRVPFVQVVRSTGFAIMDDYAVNAIKLSSPFPPVPDEFSKKGVPILATFNYVVDTSLVNLLR